MERVVSLAQRKLTDSELEFCQYMSPSSQKAFAKLSKHNRERMVSSICHDLARKGYDVSDIQPSNSSYLAYASGKTGAKAITKPARAILEHKRKKRRKAYYVKRSALITTMDGEINRKLVREIANPKEKGRQKAIEKAIESDKAQQKQYKKDTKKFNKAYDKTNGKIMKKDKRLAKRKDVYKKIGKSLDDHFKKNGNKDARSKSGEQVRKEFEQKLMGKVQQKVGNKATSFAGKLMLKLLKLLIKIIAAFCSFLISILPIVIIVVIIVVVLSFLFSLFAEEEEEKLRAEQSGAFGAYSISADVERYREKILREAKKYNYGDYIDLYLAVVMQESGGKGTDIFQCSESLGKKVGTLSVDASIKQGVKYLSGMMKRAKIRKVDDIARIKIALQAYNMSGGYITYITNNVRRNAYGVAMSKVKWTQANVLAYQKLKANGKKREDNIDTLGPYAYGDAYYTEHVLRYYTYADGMGKLNVKVGVASKVKKSERVNFLFGGGLPLSEAQMNAYKITIQVPIINEKGKKTTMPLTVHKKLAAEYMAIFQDMVKVKFPIKSASTASYVWRPIAGTNTLSQHSYGVAIDVNWNDNPQLRAPFVVKAGVPARYGGKTYDPKPRGNNKYALTRKVIAIWNAHGFSWGGTWLNNTDTMHFSYTE